MEGYKFRLQKLLDIRIDKEEECKRVFKEAQMEKEKVEEKLNKLYDNYDKYKKTSEHETIAERKIKFIYLNALSSNINDTKLELQSKIKKLEERREELKQKQVDRKTVETLKDKQLQAYIKEQNLIEQKANDEFALFGFIRMRERR